jgi:DNA-binding response OmpR family regulator
VTTRVLLLTGDEDLDTSIAELLALDGLTVARDRRAEPVHVVLADLDHLPEDWSLRLLRQRIGRLPCLLMSGSPFSGPYTATTLARGYFLYKPFSPEQLLVRLRRCVSEGSLGC